MDDYLYAGTESRMNVFEEFLSSKFEIGKFARGNLSLMGCNISQSSYFSITVCQKKVLEQLDPRLLLDAAGLHGDRPATIQQATA